MSPWQLPIALLWRQVERVEVLAVSCSGYAVQVIAADGRVQALRPIPAARQLQSVASRPVTHWPSAKRACSLFARVA